MVGPVGGRWLAELVHEVRFVGKVEVARSGGGSNGGAGCVQRQHRRHDVDDGFGRQPGHGGAADVRDAPRKPRGQNGFKQGSLGFELRGPGAVVGDEFDRRLRLGLWRTVVVRDHHGSLGRFTPVAGWRFGQVADALRRAGPVRSASLQTDRCPRRP